MNTLHEQSAVLPPENITPGFCYCGCGQQTKVATKTHRKSGHVKGLPVRFILGHSRRHPRPESAIVVIEGIERRTIPLTQGCVAIVDAEDFERLNSYTWAAKRGEAHCEIYAMRNVLPEHTTVMMHSEVLPPRDGFEIDHIDGNGLHNWRANLRYATHSQNQQNQNKTRKTTNPYKGIYWNSRSSKWQASIGSNNERFHLGYFLSAEDAARAYDAAAVKYHKQFARLNFSR